MVSSRCKKNLPSLRVDDDFMQEDDDYLPTTKKADVDSMTLKTSIPKSITCLTIEGSVVNAGETIEPDQAHLYEAQDDDDDDDNWEHPEETEEFFSSNDTEDAENMSQTSWEEISEVSSVHSFHSKTGMTFLDVARLATQNKIADANNQEMDNWVAIAKARNQETANEDPSLNKEGPLKNSDSMDDVGDMFDSQFMLDGAKGIRGGKEKFMFKRQPKKKYRQWRSKNQLGTMLSCGARMPENNMISDRQGNRIMVKA
ncbi:unnamed protein product [Cylindrotheca closterium]|uniref:Uncharacterized protein n=1 Tax=Cylindrotheca closterium TaxID=2856 RepID=A0AAD2CKI6_9STRA|nr:unnamed protein product [Cylindrotheca closterium]